MRRCTAACTLANPPFCRARQRMRSGSALVSDGADRCWGVVSPVEQLAVARDLTEVLGGLAALEAQGRLRRDLSGRIALVPAGGDA